MQLPLLSFVIINWNYGRFLGAAIDSIRSQDYPHFECLYVDNGSTDNSREIAEEHFCDDPRFSSLHLPENLGQLGAAVRVIDRVRGEYFCLVDSDDLLFPTFASSHVQVHSALAEPVGLTSSNFVEIDSEGQVLSGGGLPLGANGLRRIGVAAVMNGEALLTIKAADYTEIGDRLTILPSDTRGWLWAPGSSNVYRRSLVEEACRIAPAKIALNYAADTLFNQYCHLLSGSAILDLPLSAYRIHGTNTDTSFIRLTGARAQSRSGQVRSAQQRIGICVSLIHNCEEVIRLRGPEFFWKALDNLPREPSDIAANEEILRALCDRINVLIEYFGSSELVRNLRARIPGRALRHIFAHVGSIRQRVALERSLAFTALVGGAGR